MAIATYDDLHEYMVPELPGATKAIINQALWRAGHDFIEKSRAWEQTLTAINLVASQTEYYLTIPWRAVVEAIIDVRINTAAGVTAGNDGELLDDRLYWLERTDSSTGLKLVLADSETPAEAVTSGLVVKVCLVPVAGEHELPQWFFDRYFEGIVGLAMYDLMTRHPEDAWFNPGRGEYYRKRARNLIGSGRADRMLKGRATPRGLLESPYEHEIGGFEW
jgi:hypothetical protein